MSKYRYIEIEDAAFLAVFSFVVLYFTVGDFAKCFIVSLWLMKTIGTNTSQTP